MKKTEVGGTNFSSQEYWEQRYLAGGNSGAGSYGVLANYKAGFLNDFVSAYGINSVVDFGCGDGNQLEALRISKYTGVDVSKTAISLCRKRFSERDGWTFLEWNDGMASEICADISISLDVIYHLVEDAIFETYMKVLFASSARYVLIYSSDFNRKVKEAHMRHRSVTSWVARNTNWDVVMRPQNPHHFRENDTLNTSFAGFVLFAPAGSEAIPQMSI